MTYSREEILNRNEDVNCLKVRLSHPSLVIQGILSVFVKETIFLVECKIGCSLKKKKKILFTGKSLCFKVSMPLPQGRRSSSNPPEHTPTMHTRRCCVFRHLQEVTSQRPHQRLCPDNKANFGSNDETYPAR